MRKLSIYREPDTQFVIQDFTGIEVMTPRLLQQWVEQRLALFDSCRQLDRCMLIVPDLKGVGFEITSDTFAPFNAITERSAWLSVSPDVLALYDRYRNMVGDAIIRRIFDDETQARGWLASYEAPSHQMSLISEDTSKDSPRASYTCLRAKLD